MNTKAFKQGDPCPPATGKIRMYQMRFCPFSERARLVLAHKNIDCELVNINLHSKPDWYLEKQPNGKIPCLEFPDGRRLYDSGIVSEFLDAEYPDNKLTPSDPYTGARHKLIVEENFGKMFSPYYKATFASKGQDKESLKAFFDALEGLENSLTSKFFGGESPAMVDFMLWPVLERLEMTETICDTKRPDGSLTKLAEYMARMADLPAVKKCRLPTEIHVEHAKLHFAGDPSNFDVGI